MTATPNFASDAIGVDVGAAPAAGAAPFVLNLCSSTTPMALAQTDLPELRRFTFFVSRRFEEGRERFRLHMGYFATLAEAEEWLSVVREIYPGAWAGEAPGRKLRERAAAAAAAQAQHAAGPQPHAAAVPVARAPVRAPLTDINTAPPPAPASQPAAMRVPVVHAAPPVARAAATRSAAAPAVHAATRAAAPAAPAPRAPAKPAPLTDINTAPPPPPRGPGAPIARAAAPPSAVPAARVPAAHAPVGRPPAARVPARPAALTDINTAPPPPARSAPAPRPSAPAVPPAAPTAPAPGAHPAAPAAARAAKTGVKPVFEDSNVREVLKALGDASATGETRLMRAPPPPREAAAQSSSMSDTQVLKLLETRRPEGAEAQTLVPTEEGGIPLLKPDDTGTRLALKDAVVSNAPVSFAVQLQWSVQPAELDKVPPLAIFSAYTLYTVEGSREGRKWYGLRLGFFSDAISAKQVAYYVRSEFASVAVVPVSPQEKARATDQDVAAALANPPPARPDPMDEFKLIDDDKASRAPGAPAQPARAAAPRAAPASTVAAAAKPAIPGARVAPGGPGRPDSAQLKGRVRSAPKVSARDSRSPQTLEETLEILGASQLSIDSGNGETLNDSAVRHLRVEVQKNSPFSKLLERLSERLRKP